MKKALFIFPLIWFVFSTANADIATVENNAVNWLEQQQLVDGGWGEPELKVLYTAEAATALYALNQKYYSYYQAITWLENHSADNIDYISRKIIALYPHGSSIQTEVDYLQQLQIESGEGWGLSEEYMSSALDTALVLNALIKTNSSVNYNPGLTFLTNTQLPDGGWGVEGGTTSDIMITATVVETLNLYKSLVPSLTTVIDNGIVYLGNTVSTASQLLDIASTLPVFYEYEGLSPRVSALYDFLIQAQLPTGSWDGNVYTTAKTISTISGINNVSAHDVIFIEDLNLRAAINNALNKSEMDTVTRGELEKVTYLDASNYGITSLVGLEAAVNLTFLDIRNNQIDDLSPISQLSSLSEVLQDEAPSIVNQPVDVTVDEGGIATFNVVATGTAPMTYQWQRDGLDIVGETGSSLTLSNLTNIDSGAMINVVITNSVGIVISNTALLTVNANTTPVASATAITNATEGDIVTLDGSASSDADGDALTYAWVSVDPSIVLTDATSAIASFTAPTVLTDTNYTFDLTVSDGLANSSSSVVVTIAPADTAPVIVTQPTAVTVDEGSSAIFTVTATGTAPMTYQWQRDGVDIVGETSSGLTLINVDLLDDNVVFTIVISNAAGVTTSTGAVLTVNPVSDTQTFGYVQTLGVSDYSIYSDVVRDVFTDSAGNVYQSGAYRYTLDFDASPGVDEDTSGYYQDAFVRKINADGTYAWTWRSKGYYGGYATATATDAQGNVYIVGDFSGTTDFDPGSSYVSIYGSGRDQFYAKLDVNGQLQWVKHGGNDYLKDVVVDSQGYVYIASTITTTLLRKIDPADGSVIWTHGATYDATSGTNLGASGLELAIDSFDNIYLAGTFKDTVHFDPYDSNADGNLETYMAEGTDVYVMKLNTEGTVGWVWPIGGTGNDGVYALQATSIGVHLLGNAGSNVDYDRNGIGDLRSNGGTFLSYRLTDGSYGNTQLNKRGTDFGFDASNNLYLTGTYAGTIDFNPDAVIEDTQSSNGNYDVFVTKYFANGDYAWTQSLGGTSTETVSSMNVAGNGNLFLTGTFKNTVDFDPGAGVVERTSNGYQDMYLLHLNSN